MVELLEINRALMVSVVVMVITIISLTFSITKLYFERIVREKEKENFLLKVKILELLNKKRRVKWNKEK